MREKRGRRILLRYTKWSDIDDYIRWNYPENEFYKFDGPWYDHAGDYSGSIKSLIRDLKENKNQNWCFEIVVKEGDIHIGGLNVSYSDKDPHQTQIGIGIYETKFWDKGFGTEALALLLDYLFLEKELTRVGFTTWSGNPRMIKVGEKLGFSLEARIRRCIYVFGDFYDKIQMGILKEEWKEIRGQFL
jgi:RimJ/RimL family protein N-acetyltransferase